MTVRRNLQLEEEIIRRGCRGITNPDRFIAHSRQRSISLSGEYVHDPMLIAEGRKRRLDMREELADCGNHGLFDWQAHPGDPDNEQLLAAFGLIVPAYNLLLPT